MANYNLSTRSRVADLVLGLRVETSTLTNTTYLHQDQWELFNVYGRIQLRQLFLEILTDCGADAVTVQFNYTFTTPAITVKPLTAASAAITSMVRGGRVTWLGGAVATAAGVTVATGGCSDLVQDKSGAILGGAGFIGSIGLLTAGANASAGTSVAVLYYVPMSDGAYVEKNI